MVCIMTADEVLKAAQAKNAKAGVVDTSAELEAAAEARITRLLRLATEAEDVSGAGKAEVD